MPRLIDADKLRTIRSIQSGDFNSIETIQKWIDDAPTVEAEPARHGRWLKSGQSFVFPNKFLNYFCSECGYELDKSIRTKYNYCPNCGAKMDGGKDDPI